MDDYHSLYRGADLQRQCPAKHREGARITGVAEIAEHIFKAERAVEAERGIALVRHFGGGEQDMWLRCPAEQSFNEGSADAVALEMRGDMDFR